MDKSTEKGTRIKSSLVVLIFFVGLAILLALAEGVTRYLEGMPLTQMRLPSVSRLQIFPPTRPDGTDSLDSIPVAGGVDRAWFASEPPALPGRDSPDSELLLIQDRIPIQGMAEFDMYKRWNRRLLDQERCGYFRYFPGFAFAFDPTEPIPHPRYRYLRNTVTPLQLVTNQFGWRGPQVELNKPDRTIRIAFVGASTTVNFHRYPHSYPELVGHWLRRWVQERYPEILVEVINAGREGINSTDIAAVVRQELVPVEPDLVVYYEGANEFSPGTVYSVPNLVPRAPSVKERWDRVPWIAWLYRYSVLAHRVGEFLGMLSAGDGLEPVKPIPTVAWPEGVSEEHPALTHEALPLNLAQILSNLDGMRRVLQSRNSELVLTSFVWLVHDGMALNPARHHGIYRYLNSTFYPYRYKDMRRLADFQNHAYAEFANVHGLEFMDVAGVFPQDPDLFTDAIHNTYAGVRLRAWVVLQQLIPIIKRGIDTGRWPRPDQEPLEQHPAFVTPETTVDVHC